MEVSITVPIGDDRLALLGSGDRNLKMIRESLGVTVTSRGAEVRIKGDKGAVAAARNVLERLGRDASGGQASRRKVLEVIAEEADRGGVGSAGGPDGGGLQVYGGAGRPIRALSPNQQAYLDAIGSHDLVFAVGPAGTGKTYLAVATAVHLLRTDRARKLVLVRPAVEAGERLGFLPGDMQAKVNPYLRPLFDALHDMMDFASIRRLMDHDVVEVAPLAFMRGRTLNGAVVILDEAQNTTRGQMKMFLTRLGQGSKMIVTGDTTQIDLPDPRDSGLIDAVHRLKRTPGVACITLERCDVVRHDLVQRIVEAYGESTA